MNPRKLIDVEMEQTGEALKSSSYKARQVNTETVNQRLKNPATNKSWFEVPSAEYQSWEDKNRRLDLEDRKAVDNQTVGFNLDFLNKVRTKENDEKNRAMGNELKTKFPYAQYETESKLYGAADRARDIAVNAGQALKYNMGNYVSF